MSQRRWESDGGGAQHPGWPARPDPLRVDGSVVALRPVRWRDAGAWSRIRLRDRDYLERWEPTSSGTWEERNSAWAWPSQCLSLRSLARRGQCLPFVITVDGALAGQITVGNIVRAALRSAWVGYWVASDLAGRGVATAALAMITDHAFGPGQLHRLEATVRPENTASIRVLTKAGFRREGLFERYLNVAGSWRDHVAFAVTAEETGPGLVERLVSAGAAAYLHSS